MPTRIKKHPLWVFFNSVVWEPDGSTMSKRVSAQRAEHIYPCPPCFNSLVNPRCFFVAFNRKYFTMAKAFKG